MQRILRHKKVIVFLVIYLVFLGWTLHTFSGSPPGNEIEVYKGVLGSNQVVLTDAKAQEMKEAGVNTYRFTPGVFIDSQGNIHELPFMKQLTIEHIQTAHRNGLQVYLDMKNNYGTTWEDRFGEGCFVLSEKLWPTFFEQYNKKVLEYADIAEKYGVELFVPMHEQDGVIGAEILHDRGSLSGFEKASEWGQEILPKIRERYHGKLVWEGGFSSGRLMPSEQYLKVLDELYINFTGYDYIGFSTSPTFAPEEGPEEYRECVRHTIDTLSKWAERDGCEGVIAAEMTLAYDVTSTGWKDFLAYDIVFEAGEGKLNGYIPGFGSESEDREYFKYWYKERLP